MPLQIRRGTTAERLSITPLIGELIYDTTTGELFVGNGTTPGGSSAISGITVEVAQDAAATLFTSGSHTGINFVYNDETNTIDATVTATSSGTFDGDVIGSVFADNSTLLVDGVNGKIVAPININDNEIFDGAGDTGLNIRSNQTDGNIYLYSYGSDGNGTGAGNIYVKSNAVEIYSDWQNGGAGEKKWTFGGSGSLTFPDATVQTTAYPGPISSLDGDVTGSVFADNSTLLVNGVDGRVVGPIYADVYKSNGSLIINHATGAITASNEADAGEINIQRINAGSSPVVLNDIYSHLNGAGWNGSNYIVGTRIFSRVIESSLGTGMPSEIGFQVNDNANNLTTMLSVLGGATERIEGYRPLVIFDDAYRSTGAILGLYQYHDTQDATNVVFARTRGTGTAQAAVQKDDDIADLVFLGGNGSGYTPAASISVIVDDNLTTSLVPGRLSIRIGDGVNGTQERLTIDHLGVTTITGSLNVVGDITGTLISGSSSMLIDGTDGSMMVANINLKGETGNTPGDAVTVDSWLEVLVNGQTKYVPLYA